MDGLHPFLNTDVPSLVAERARTRRDHPFIIWEPLAVEGRNWTYGEFHAEVEQVAAGLLSRGVVEGDTVLIHMENAPEMLLAWYACARIGAVGVTTNARSAADELAYFADHAAIVGAITQPAFAELVAANAPSAKWMAVIDHNAGAPAGDDALPDGAEPFSALFGDAASVPDRAPDPMLPVGIQYTSGTTSRPKGVVWTHANALWGGRVNALHEDLRAEDVHLCYLPLFHTNAQAYSVLATLWAGGTCVLMPRWSTSRFWDISVKHRCTWTSMIWFCLSALENVEPPKEHFYRLWGNAMCDPPQAQKIGVKTVGWWGMTETMTHGIVGHVHLENRSLAIGKPAPEYGVAVVRDDGTPVEPGETGHLKILGVPGVSLFKEYLHNPEATRDTYDENGWFITGDLVTLHEDGYISFSSRDKDMLKVGGENVAAIEIERVLMTIDDIVEVAVVGKPDPMLNEVPVAFVRVDGGPDQAAPDLESRAIGLCTDKLADFKVPREIRVIDDFPRSTLEKIAKVQLKSQLS